MTQETKHIPAYCNINGCEREADYWLEVKGFVDDTFYLCGHHYTELANDEGNYTQLDTELGTITEREIAGYSCSESCGICND